jgi:hypothetical protein
MHDDDDRFNPNNIDDDVDVDDDDYGYNYVGNDNASVTSFATSVNSQKKKNRKIYEDLKSIDKGYHKFPIFKNGVKSSIEVYSTVMIPGAPIRDAITGARDQTFRVGSLDEHQFFKTAYTGLGCGSDTIILFFDSPEQYERHMCSVVDAKIKTKWLDKCMEIRKRNQNVE